MRSYNHVYTSFTAWYDGLGRQSQVHLQSKQSPERKQRGSLAGFRPRRGCPFLFSDRGQTVTKTDVIGVRVTPDERRKVQELADQAGTTPSEVLRALVRAAVEVRPAQPAEATITNWTQPGADHAAMQQA